MHASSNYTLREAHNIVSVTVLCDMRRRYNVETIDEICGRERKRVPFYWESGMDPGASTVEMEID
ncbi:MAG: hypothetical protein KF749_12840 [Bacteroidetes bacterium]|nr:hypothetical protein [Bacteroidota bacterium]MCW5894418.1 hypothetical protein [Bacteroidota bacterium]